MLEAICPVLTAQITKGVGACGTCNNDQQCKELQGTLKMPSELLATSSGDHRVLLEVGGISGI